jgi:hypothetical protein
MNFLFREGMDIIEKRKDYEDSESLLHWSDHKIASDVVLLPAIIQVQWKPNVICGGAEERD